MFGCVKHQLSVSDKMTKEYHKETPPFTINEQLNASSRSSASQQCPFCVLAYNMITSEAFNDTLSL